MTTTVAGERRLADSPAERLRKTMVAARVSFTWFGTRKTLTPEQKAQAAEAFGAAGQFLSAGKKLIDTSHAAFKAVGAVRGRAIAYWRALSLPFPEPGIRLIRQDCVEAFDRQLQEFKEELARGVEHLETHFGSLQAMARERLGRLYNPADYPQTLVGLFAIAWDFPGVEAPDYLRQLNPKLYQEECQRISARFDEAVQLAEVAFQDELARLIEHLTERLSGTEDGKPKVFRDSAVGNLRDFFERFKSLNVRSNEQLDDLVGQCQRIVQGVQPRQLRDDDGLRQRIAAQLVGVQSVLDGLLVDRPRRRLVRTAH